MDAPGDCPALGTAVPAARVGRTGAGIAATPEGSLHTSFHARVEHCREAGELDGLKDGLSTETSQTETERTHWLLPIEDRREQGEAVLGLLGGFTLYFGRLQNLREMAARRGKRWVKNHGTRAAVLGV